MNKLPVSLSPPFQQNDALCLLRIVLLALCGIGFLSKAESTPYNPTPTPPPVTKYFALCQEEVMEATSYLPSGYLNPRAGDFEAKRVRVLHNSYLPFASLAHGSMQIFDEEANHLFPSSVQWDGQVLHGYFDSADGTEQWHVQITGDEFDLTTWECQIEISRPGETKIVHPPALPPIRIHVIGDGHVTGGDGADPDTYPNGFRLALYRELNKRAIPFRFEGSKFGPVPQTGYQYSHVGNENGMAAALADLQQPLYGAGSPKTLEQQPADVVCVMAGSWEVTQANYSQGNMSNLLNAYFDEVDSQNTANAPVIIRATPFVKYDFTFSGVLGSVVNQRITNLNALLSAEATGRAAAGRHYVFDTDTATMWSDTASNGVELSLGGADLIASQWADDLLALDHLGKNCLSTVKDYDGDGYPDILWRRSSDGATAIHFYEEENFLRGRWTTQQVSNSARIAGIGDFDGDGKADILWDGAGGTSIHFMDGETYLAPGKWTSAQVAAPWEPVGVGDFDGDGKADVLYQNSVNLMMAIHYMDAEVMISQQSTYAVGWDIEGVADFNGDGMADLLLRNPTTRAAAFHYLNDGSFAGAAAPSSQVTSASWDLVGAADFDSNGSADLLWRSKVDGRSVIHYYDGVTYDRGRWISSQVTNLSWFPVLE